MPMNLPELNQHHVSTRDELQRVVTHVLARRRAALCGRFGLRATPGGIGTPAGGPDLEVVRVSGTRLLREVTGETATTTSLDLAGATLTAAAALVGVDLTEPFEAGHDTPPLGDPDEPLALDVGAARLLHDWFDLGWRLLDTTLGALGPDARPSVVQLWPEHFDVGVDVATGGERRANLGASAGDGYLEEPYLYVGPWDDARPGDPAYWNAPFGAVLPYGELRSAPDPVRLGSGFLLRGVALLSSATTDDAEAPTDREGSR